MERELMYPRPEANATPEDFQDTLRQFREEMNLLFTEVSKRFPETSSQAYENALAEFDNRLYIMAVGLRPDLDAKAISFLVKEAEIRKGLLLKSFDNPDTIKDAGSLEKMIPRTTEFIRVALVSNDALMDEALEGLKELDSRHRD